MGNGLRRADFTFIVSLSLKKCNRELYDWFFDQISDPSQIEAEYNGKLRVNLTYNVNEQAKAS